MQLPHLASRLPMVSQNALRDAGGSGVAIAVIASISSMKYPLSQVHFWISPCSV